MTDPQSPDFGAHTKALSNASDHLARIHRAIGNIQESYRGLCLDSMPAALHPMRPKVEATSKFYIAALEALDTSFKANLKNPEHVDPAALERYVEAEAQKLEVLTQAYEEENLGHIPAAAMNPQMVHLVEQIRARKHVPASTPPDYAANAKAMRSVTMHLLTIHDTIKLMSPSIARIPTLFTTFPQQGEGAEMIAVGRAYLDAIKSHDAAFKRRSSTRGTLIRCSSRLWWMQQLPISGSGLRNSSRIWVVIIPIPRISLNS